MAWIYTEEIDCPHEGVGKACGRCVAKDRARLTRERDEARGQSEARGTHVRCLDAEVRSLRTRAEQAEAERGEAHGLALDYKGQAERLRIERDRLREAGEAVVRRFTRHSNGAVGPCNRFEEVDHAVLEEFRAALRGEEGSP